MSRALVLAVALAAGLAACEDFPVGLPPVAEIRISAPRTTLLVGQSERYEATVVGFDGDPIERAKVRWRSLHPEIATVDAGTVTARSPGTATIVAESAEQKAFVAVAVVPRAARIEIVGREAVVVGDTILLAARVTSALGERIERPVRWASLDHDVALVAKNGSVRGVMPGEAPIVALLEGLADTTEVRVIEPEESPFQ